MTPPLERTTPGADRLADLLRQVREIAALSGRDDLARRLDGEAERLADPSVRVVVVGQFKQGKSALVNALVEAPVCPTDDVIGTAIPTVVRHGDQVSATLVRVSEGETVETPIAVGSLRDHVTELSKVKGALQGARAEVSLPREVLRDGLVLVDTPGVGGTTAAHAASTLAMVPTADAVLMLSDASQEYTEPELTFLRQALTLCPIVTCVLSKTDLQPHWREILETDRRHLRTADVDAEVVPVSSYLHGVARTTGDAELAQESGIPELAQRLRTDVVERVNDRTRRQVADEVRAVSEHLQIALQSELETLNDPSRGPVVIRSLEEARETAAALNEQSAKWQQTLGDGISELISDIDHDLRDRLRRVSREAEQLLDEIDPGEVWDEFGQWLADSVAQSVADNFVWAHQRAEWLAAKVAEHFAVEGSVALPELRLSDTEGVFNAITGLDIVRSGHMSPLQKAMVGVKGSYGGVLMTGLVTSMVGMALVNPISVAAGVLLGGFAYRQDSGQRLERRQGEARIAVRRLIDDAIFQVGKESRDRLNGVRRLLRDHFTGLAEDLRRSLKDSIESAKRGAALEAPRRGDRVGDLTTRLQVLRSLSHQADAIAGTATEVTA